MHKLLDLEKIKWAFAGIIIVMGAYGYFRFLYTPGSGEPVWMVMFLFVIVEAVVLVITTKKFSDVVAYEKRMGVMLFFAYIFMILVSGTGIDQTIWGMVEAKYKASKQSALAVQADAHTQTHLQTRAADLKLQLETAQAQLASLREEKEQTVMLYGKHERTLRDVIWYNGNRCDRSSDCMARKEVAQKALELSNNELTHITNAVGAQSQKIALLEQELLQTVAQEEAIIARRVEFEKEHRLTLENKVDEAIMHNIIMEGFNTFLPQKIETPERAYVLLLSFMVYPMYLLLLYFIARNTPEAIIQRQQREQALLAARNMSKKPRGVAALLRKTIGYLIATRKRKIAEIEVIKEVEVVKEVENIVYKEGKEIVEVERIVKVPMIEKEFVVIPADVNLNSVNELTKSGSTPADLMEILKRMRGDAPKEETPKEKKETQEETLIEETTPLPKEPKA